MYSCSCRAHFFIHLHMYMSLYHCVSLWKCKKIQYHLDIVIFLHSEYLLIIFGLVGWLHLPGESQDFLVVAPPCDS